MSAILVTVWPFLLIFVFVVCGGFSKELFFKKVAITALLTIAAIGSAIIEFKLEKRIYYSETIFFLLGTFSLLYLTIPGIVYFRRRAEQKRDEERQRKYEEIRQEQEEKEQELITSNIDAYLKRALEIMDTTAKWYSDENQATIELVNLLKAQGISDVEYQRRLGNGRVAGARVGAFLIEAKLSPSTRDVDTLIGQMGVYTQYTNKLNIVIYGQLTKEARERIVNEIDSRYKNRVFLTYLNNPRRQRATPM